MRIAITSAFAPSIGGIECVADLLSREFVGAGHEVVVLASNAGPGSAGPFPFPVHYRPAARRRRETFRWCDCILQFGFGLKALWPNCVTLKPVVVSHQGLYNPRDGATKWVDRLKNHVAAVFTNVAASTAVARNLPAGTIVIPNCYDPQTFGGGDAEAPRGEAVVCAARLVRDKGVDILLDAVGELRAAGRLFGVTIVGDGPERSALEAQAMRLGIADQVRFVGAKSRPEVAAIFRRHRVAIVPSRYEEAFGIVALEAIASGCAVIAANRGGLPEAVGPAGLLFDPGRPQELTHALQHVLDSNLSPHASPQIMAHLERHSPRIAARRYLEVMKACLSAEGGRTSTDE